MKHFKITLVYEGTDFVGWQRQATGTSIQGLVEDALGDLDGRDVRVTGAGRTDAGVHALGQVADFLLERSIATDALARALNARLPDAVRVVSVEAVPPAFNARSDARTKRYRYRIWNGAVISPFQRRYAWHVVGDLDVDHMAAAARLVEGEHDFAAFRASGSSTNTTVRVVTSSLVLRRAQHERELQPLVLSLSSLGSARDDPEPVEGSKDDPLIVYEIAGTGFLRHMVRNIVGTLVEIGHRRRPVEWMADVLASRDRTRAGPTAPAEGLFLVGVVYN